MANTPMKIRSLQRKLYRVSKQKGDYRFYSLYDKVLPSPLFRGFPVTLSQGK